MVYNACRKKFMTTVEQGFKVQKGKFSVLRFLKCLCSGIIILESRLYYTISMLYTYTINLKATTIRTNNKYRNKSTKVD